MPIISIGDNENNKKMIIEPQKKKNKDTKEQRKQKLQ